MSKPMSRSQTRAAMRSRLAHLVRVEKSAPGAYRVEFRLHHTEATALLGDDNPGFLFDGNGFDLRGARRRRLEVIAMIVDGLCPAEATPRPPAETDLDPVG